VIIYIKLFIILQLLLSYYNYYYYFTIIYLSKSNLNSILIQRFEAFEKIRIFKISKNFEGSVLTSNSFEDFEIVKSKQL